MSHLINDQTPFHMAGPEGFRQHSSSTLWTTNCRKCNWENLPTPAYYLLLCKELDEAENSAPESEDPRNNVLIFDGVTGVESVVPRQTYLTRFDCTISNITEYETIAKFKNVLKTKISGFNTFFITKEGETENDIAIMGDSIMSAVCAAKVDVFAMNGMFDKLIFNNVET